KRVEYWVRPVPPPPANSKPAPLADDAAELLRGPWGECALQPQPADWAAVLPAGFSAKRLLGFDKGTGRPLAWPPRYGMIGYTATIEGLRPGHYEIRARAVDLNDFAQPQPRPSPKSGRNAIQVRRVAVI